jgi:transposase-like protein
MEVKIIQQTGVDKHKQSTTRKSGHRGYRLCRLGTHIGVIYFTVPKECCGGDIPLFVTERKRKETTFIEIVQEANIQDLSTCNPERLIKRLGLESFLQIQVSELTKELPEPAELFYILPLEYSYAVIWVDAAYEKVCHSGSSVFSMAIQHICSVNESGQRAVIAIDPLLEKSRGDDRELFQQLKGMGISQPSHIIYNAFTGLVSSIKQNFQGSCWQRCMVPLMCKIPAHVWHRGKECFAQQVILIGKTLDFAKARTLLEQLSTLYRQLLLKTA